MPEDYNSISSTTALAGLLVVNTVAITDGTSALTSSLTCDLLASLPECQAAGMTDHGWRADAMLRALYEALSPEHKALVDGEALEFQFTVWQMMTGDMVSL